MVLEVTDCRVAIQQAFPHNTVSVSDRDGTSTIRISGLGEVLVSDYGFHVVDAQGDARRTIESVLTAILDSSRITSIPLDQHQSPSKNSEVS